MEMVAEPFAASVCCSFIAAAPTEIDTLSLHDALPIYVTWTEKLALGARVEPPSKTRLLPEMCQEAADGKDTSLKARDVGGWDAVKCTTEAGPAPVLARVTLNPAVSPAATGEASAVVVT